MATHTDLTAEGFTVSTVSVKRLDIGHRDPFGRGPFCRLTVTTTAPTSPGVYAWVHGDDVQYIGMSRALLQIVNGQRMGAAYNDYTYIPPSQVARPGDPRVRINGLLNRALSAGGIVTWWWRCTEDAAAAGQLEAILIERWSPPWNRARPIVPS